MKVPLFGPDSDPNYAGPPRPPRGEGEQVWSGQTAPPNPGDGRSAPPQVDPPDDLGMVESSRELTQRHREIIRLAFLGRTQAEIAERMSMDRSTIRFILRSPMAQAELARLNQKAETILVNTPLRVALDADLRAAATESLRLNRSVLSDPTVDMKVRTRTAQHFMDKIIFSDGPDEQESSYRDILRRLDAIDRNVRLNGTGVALFPPGSIENALHGGNEEIKNVNAESARDSGGGHASEHGDRPAEPDRPR